MSFRTELEITAKLNLDPSIRIITSGSCFAENIFSHYQQLGFNISCNPFGTTYNPISLARQTRMVLSGTPYKKSHLCKNRFQYFSFDHDGTFSDPDPEICLDRINSKIAEAHLNIRNSDVVILTLGTAFTYSLNHHCQDFLDVVNNCHKEDIKKFQRNLIKADVLTKYLRDAIRELIAVKANLKVILTVSPVRHLRDSFTENQVSKAQLISTCHELTEKNVSYFPAYEIMMDDLRDYRFYSEDLIHPSPTAINYIVEKFSSYIFDISALEYINAAQKLLKRKKHRPIIRDSSEIEAFKLKTKNLEEIHLQKYPWSNPIRIACNPQV